MLVFPHASELYRWGRVLIEAGLPKRVLPDISLEWATTVEDDFALTAMHIDNDDLLRSGARIFHRIIKNHRFVDGNKRSAVLCTYIFFVENGYRLTIPSGDLYDLAKLVAADTSNDTETIVGALVETWRNHIERLST